MPKNEGKKKHFVLRAALGMLTTFGHPGYPYLIWKCSLIKIQRLFQKYPDRSILTHGGLGMPRTVKSLI